MELGPWKRSMKRKLEQMERESVARVDIDDERVELSEILLKQKQAIEDLRTDLEEERSASSSAASEAMSMILRLQREKAEVQMEDRQFKRFAEEKMAQDHHEIVFLEDALYKRQLAIQALWFEVEAFKHRLLSYGIDPEGRGGIIPVGLDGIGGMDYPLLRCEVHEVDDVLEKGVLVGNSPRRNNHSRRFSTDSVGSYLGREYGRFDDFPVAVDTASDGGGRDDAADRVYTVDKVYGVQRETDRDSANVGRDEPEIQKLYMKLQELEEDRESLKETVAAMKTDKAQLVLLKEITQNLSKSMAQSSPLPEKRVVRRQPFLGGFSFIVSLFKWAASFFFWKTHRSK